MVICCNCSSFKRGCL